MKVKSESEVAQSCLTISNPIDCSLPGSSAHGIFQARVLERGAIAFSDVQKLIMNFKMVTTEHKTKHTIMIQETQGTMGTYGDLEVREDFPVYSLS